MESFLAQLAGNLYQRYGDEISSLRIIFPSRRARLFFTDALSTAVDKPLWQPEFGSIDELAEEVAGIEAGDRIRLITELYKVYSRYHDEPFDSFYFWGEILLSDFDSIDKYLIDADMLFANIADLKAIEDNFDFLTEDQRAVIARFWRSFGEEADYSDLQQRFMSVWNTLGDIYHEYRRSLASAGLAYTGMVYRLAADRIRQCAAGAGHMTGTEFGAGPKGGNAAGAGAATLTSPGAENRETGMSEMKVAGAAGDRRRYVVAGFNALSECEKVLFDYLSRAHDVEFFWDYDRYYLDDPDQEAGLFLRENVKRFPQTIELPYDYRGFTERKDITVVSAPSDSLQCKYIAEFLEDAAHRGGYKPDKETAIVLTDENLLVPALYSIPDQVERINVTMGYPLKLTLAYSFVERLIMLQSRRRIRGDATLFYHEDVKGLLNHPYLAGSGGAAAGTGGCGDGGGNNTCGSGGCGNEAAGQSPIIDLQQVYVDGSQYSQFLQGGLSELLFSSAGEDWESLADYLRRVVREVAASSGPDDDKTERRQRLEFFMIILENLDKLQNSLSGCGIELSGRVFASLLRRLLQSVRIPYEGEPLQGVQVMGILETRNLDFENVLLLSVNDDTFPGNRSSQPSFIPHNLRMAYGLPTPQHHEGVYAYYFYRLLQRADNVHLVYSSRSDEKSSGEQSRYIYQLEYESRHDITRREISVSVNVTPCEPITIKKTEAVRSALTEFTSGGRRRLSPTSFFNYVQCPLKFYFHSIARLQPEEKVAEEIDAPIFGNILHRAMELLYTPLTGTEEMDAEVEKLRAGGQVESAVDSAIRKEYFQDADVEPGEFTGNLLLVRDIIMRYINFCILPFDASQRGITVQELEKSIDAAFEFETVDGRTEEVRFGGFSDRVDRLADGTLRIVDYKTGGGKLIFKDIASLFSQAPADWNAAALQILIYAMMFNRRTGRDVQPALYYVREMNRPGYSPLLENKAAGVPVASYIRYKEEFEAHLSVVLAELFDPSVPFVQCADSKTCTRCDFNEICKRDLLA